MPSKKTSSRLMRDGLMETSDKKCFNDKNDLMNAIVMAWGAQETRKRIGNWCQDKEPCLG